jgi:hypothetical protein
MNHKLDIGSVFSRIFSTYGSQFAVLIGIALIIFLPVAVINGLILAGDVNAIGVAISFLVSLIAGAWYTGVVVSAAEDMLDGQRDHSIGDLLSSTTRFILALIAAGFLYAIAVGIGTILLVLPGIFIFVAFGLFAPAIVVEQKGVFEAFGRSWELVKGNWWRVFLILIVVFILVGIVHNIITAIFRAIADSFVTLAIGEWIANALLAPVSALAIAIIFFGLRQAKEGGGGAPAVDAPVPAPVGPESPVVSPPPGSAPPAAGAPQPPAPGGPPPQAPPPPPGQ